MRGFLDVARRSARRNQHCLTLILTPGEKRDVRWISNTQQVEQDVVGADVRVP